MHGRGGDHSDRRAVPSRDVRPRNTSGPAANPSSSVQRRSGLGRHQCARPEIEQPPEGDLAVEVTPATSVRVPDQPHSTLN